MTDTTSPSDRDGLPPFVRSWPHLYRIIMVTLVVLIALFYLFMLRYQ